MEQPPRPARWTKTPADTMPTWGQVCRIMVALVWASASVSPNRLTSQKMEGWSKIG